MGGLDFFENQLQQSIWVDYSLILHAIKVEKDDVKWNDVWWIEQFIEF